MAFSNIQINIVVNSDKLTKALKNALYHLKNKDKWWYMLWTKLKSIIREW